MRELAGLCKARSDEPRLQILAFLSLHGELCVCDLQEILGATQSRTSRHLRYLLHSGLVHSRRDSAWVYYRIPDELDPGRREVLRTIRRLLGPEREAHLRRRLETWFERKAAAAVTCSSP